MRVLYCTDTWFPQVNGVSVVSDTSVRGLRARGWDVEVVAPRYPRSSIPSAGPDVRAADPIIVHSLPSVPAPAYPELRIAIPRPARVEAIARAFRPHLIHCTTEFIIGRMGLWTARRLGVPAVTSYHTNFGAYATLYGLGRWRGAIETAIAGMHRRAALTLTPSAAAANELGRLGVHAEVWGCGVDTEQFRPARRSHDLRVRLGLQGAFTFLLVGRLAREKGVDTVVRAFARVRERFGPQAVRLIIAGSGPEEAALHELAPPGTVFLGNIDRDHDLPALYATADAFVFASTTETLGLVVLEAMASGLPVVAIPAGGVAEHLRDGVNGIAVPAADPGAFAHAMERLVLTPGLRERLGDAAHAMAQQFGWARELDRLDAAYRQVTHVTVSTPAPDVNQAASVHSP